MTHSNRLLDELSRVALNAAGLAQGVKREAEGVVRSGVERLLRDADVVSREEFEAVREMAVLAREDATRLETRLAALEAQIKGGQSDLPLHTNEEEAPPSGAQDI